MKRLILLAAAACSTTLDAKSYSNDCDADMACVPVRVGDICSCTCTFAAINQRDFNKWSKDYVGIGACRNTCIDGGLDASFSCGEGIGAKCVSGTCATYTILLEASVD